MRTYPLLSLLLLIGGCQGIDLSPILSVLDAASMLGLGGGGAMTAIAGEGPDCVTLTPPCPGAPCAARVEVEITDACPLALGGAASGKIILDGEWSDADTATFVPDLTAVDIGIGAGRVAVGLGVVVVTRDGDEVSVVFGEQSATAESGDDSAAGADQEGFYLTVTLSGTPADPSDDTLAINGGGQSASATSGDDDEAAVKQVGVVMTVTDPACRRNPVGGTASTNEVGNENLGQTALLFHEECDGFADIVGSTADPLRSGSEVDLGYGG